MRVGCVRRTDEDALIQSTCIIRATQCILQCWSFDVLRHAHSSDRPCAPTTACMTIVASAAAIPSSNKPSTDPADGTRAHHWIAASDQHPIRTPRVTRRVGRERAPRHAREMVKRDVEAFFLGFFGLRTCRTCCLERGQGVELGPEDVTRAIALDCKCQSVSATVRPQTLVTNKPVLCAVCGAAQRREMRGWGGQKQALVKNNTRRRGPAGPGQ